MAGLLDIFRRNSDPHPKGIYGSQSIREDSWGWHKLDEVPLKPEQEIQQLRSRNARLQEQLWSGGVGYDPDMYLPPQGGGSMFFNRLSQGTRELNPLQQERAIELAYLLYESNPLGKSIVETVRDFVLGDSATVISVDPDEGLREEQQQVLDSFWNDYINLMDVKLPNKVLELGLFGEQCYPVEINGKDGHVRLGYLDSAAITKVLVDPRNVERQLAVITMVRNIGGMPEERWYRIIQPDERAGSKWYGRLLGLSYDQQAIYDADTAAPTDAPDVSADIPHPRDRNTDVPPTGLAVPNVGDPVAAGDPQDLNYLYWRDANGYTQRHRIEGDCFYFTVNKVSNATRGRSDLLTLVDWVDAFDQLLFNEVDRGLLLKAFIWDVTGKGYTDKQLDDYKSRNGQPRPGSVRYHNESIEWKAVTPDLKAADSAAAADLILSYIATGARLPKTWLNGMMDVNKATAQELGAPALARLSLRQKLVRFMLTYIATMVLDQAEMKGMLRKRKRMKGSLRPTPWAIQVNLPDLKQVNQVAVAQAYNNIIIGVAYSVQFGLIDMELARQVAVMFIKQMGIDVNEQALRERLKKSGIDPDKIPPLAPPAPGSATGSSGAAGGTKPVPAANQPTPNGATTKGVSANGTARIKASDSGDEPIPDTLVFQEGIQAMVRDILNIGAVAGTNTNQG